MGVKWFLVVGPVLFSKLVIIGALEDLISVSLLFPLTSTLLVESSV